MTLLRILLRRWYVSAAVLAVGLLAITALMSNAQPTYSASTSVILVVPNAGEEEEARNPYLDFSGSLDTTALIVADVAMSGQTRQEIAAAGLTTDYEVVPGGRVPTLQVDVEGTDKQVVRETVTGLVTQLSEILDRLQSAVAAPADQRIDVSVLVEAGSPQESMARTNRGVVAVALLTVMAAVALTLVVEHLSSSLRTRPSRSPSREPGRPIASNASVGVFASQVPGSEPAGTAPPSRR